MFRKVFSYKSFCSSRDAYIILSGGMPRASHGDRHAVTVMQGRSHVVFDFMSKVIEFLVVSSNESQDTQENYGNILIYQ